MDKKTVEKGVEELNSKGSKDTKLRGAILLSIISPYYMKIESFAKNFPNAPTQEFEKKYKDYVIVFKDGKISIQKEIPQSLIKVTIGKENRIIYVDNIYDFVNFLASRELLQGLNEDLNNLKNFLKGGTFEVRYDGQPMTKEIYIDEVERRKSIPMIVEKKMPEAMVSTKYRHQYENENIWAANRYSTFIDAQTKDVLNKEKQENIVDEKEVIAPEEVETIEEEIVGEEEEFE